MIISEPVRIDLAQSQLEPLNYKPFLSLVLENWASNVTYQKFYQRRNKNISKEQDNSINLKPSKNLILQNGTRSH
ncbi:17870_t:CDS:1, partial [Racocetra persica]